MLHRNLRTRIAAVLRLHQWRATVRMTDDDPVLDCTCGMAFGPHHTFDCYREHVADAVIRELALEREHWQYGDGHTMGVRYRYVTEWETDD